MLSTTRLRASALLQRQSLAAAASRSYAHTPKDSQELNIPAHIAEAQKAVPNVSKSNEAEFKGTANDMAISEKAEVAEQLRTWQEPNRKGVWSRSQQARPVAMSGPRFEQTIMEMQPRPHAAIELIHKQPVRWVKTRMVECDGGGGPLGHPRIFINVDKPEIASCTYCGLPFAHEHHREHLKSLPSTSYPLEPMGHEAEVNESQRITDEGYGQR